MEPTAEIMPGTMMTRQDILDQIHDHGAVPTDAADCTIVPADMDGAFPEPFYSTTNFRTQVRLNGEWIDVEDQEMDCGIIIDPEGLAARCIPMTAVRKGARIVCGHAGVRVDVRRVALVGLARADEVHRVGVDAARPLGLDPLDRLQGARRVGPRVPERRAVGAGAPRR
jgi:hypothetical protein